MKAVFADSSYYLALVNEDDELHQSAIGLTQQLSHRVVTTDWILAEIADALCRPGFRELAVALVRDLQSNELVSVVPATHRLFEQGLELYAQRDDKDWSLTDCISFVIMEQHRLRDALTADHHFEQAGFQALMKQST